MSQLLKDNHITIFYNRKKIVLKDSIYENAKLLLTNREEYDKMARAVNPYGDGHASERIARILTEWMNDAKREGCV